MGKFRVNDGQAAHRHGEGIYRAGQVLESDRDMAAAFVGRFTRVSDDTPVSQVEQVPQIKVAREPTAIEKKHEQLQAKEQKAQAAQEPAPAEQGNLGTDVTGEFPAAGDNGFRVFQKGRWYYVALADDPGRAINEKGIQREEVASYIGG